MFLLWIWIMLCSLVNWNTAVNFPSSKTNQKTKNKPKPPLHAQSFLAGYIDNFFPNHSDDLSPLSVVVHCGGVERKENCASFRLGFHSRSQGGWLSLLRQHGTTQPLCSYCLQLRFREFLPLEMFSPCCWEGVQVSYLVLVPAGCSFR